MIEEHQPRLAWRGFFILLGLLLAGCATLEAGPHRTAENTCNFLFLAALCSFGVEEIAEEEDEHERLRKRPLKGG